MSNENNNDDSGGQESWELVELPTDCGFTFCMPKGLVPSQQREIENTGKYEPPTTEAIKRFVDPGMVVLECGSNCGFHTLNLAAAVSPAGRVYTYEANPELISVIEKNVTVNGFAAIVEVYNQGVWRENTTLPFPVRKQSLGGAGLKKKTSNPIKRWKSKRKVKYYIDLEVRSLNSLCQDRGIDFLRMDVEGAEFEAIMGSLDLLRESDITIILEWIPKNTSRKRTLALYDTLRSLGYWIYRIGSQCLVRIDSGEDFHDRYQEIWQAGQRDVLCRKEDLGERVERKRQRQ